MNTYVPYREITDHKVNELNDKVTIKVLDKPGAGGANHDYMIMLPEIDEGPAKGGRACYSIHFQNGPIAEAGVNGITQEVLLAIVIDRLRSFQRGPYACRENALALTKIEEAMLWLQKRTLDRMKRGVEGTSKI